MPQERFSTERPPEDGFTLIQVGVTVALALIVIAAGIAGYVKWTRNNGSSGNTDSRPVASAPVPASSTAASAGPNSGQSSGWKLVKGVTTTFGDGIVHDVQLFESTDARGESGIGSPMYGVRVLIKRGDTIEYEFAPSYSEDSLAGFYMDDYLEAKDVTNDGAPEILFHSGYQGASDEAIGEHIIRYDAGAKSFSDVGPDDFTQSLRITARWVTVGGKTLKVVADPVSPEDANDPHSCELCSKFYEYNVYRWDTAADAFVRIQTVKSQKEFDFETDPLSEDLDFVIRRIASSSAFSNTGTPSQASAVAQRLTACGSLPNGGTRKVVDTERLFVNVPRDLYPDIDIQIVSHGATAGYISNGGQWGYALDAMNRPNCWSYYLEFDMAPDNQGGTGTVDITSKSGVAGIPDYAIHFIVASQ